MAQDAHVWSNASEHVRPEAQLLMVVQDVQVAVPSPKNSSQHDAHVAFDASEHVRPEAQLLMVAQAVQVVVLSP